MPLLPPTLRMPQLFDEVMEFQVTPNISPSYGQLSLPLHDNIIILRPQVVLMEPQPDNDPLCLEALVPHRTPLGFMVAPAAQDLAVREPASYKAEIVGIVSTLKTLRDRSCILSPVGVSQLPPSQMTPSDLQCITGFPAGETPTLCITCLCLVQLCVLSVCFL